MKKLFIVIVIVSIAILISLYLITNISGTERVSYYPINCSKLVDGCYIDWLSEYYEISPQTPSDYDKETDFSSISFQKNTEFLKDYFQKKGIIVFDVKYSGPILKKSVEDSGGWGDYDLTMSVSESDYEKILQFGFNGMGKPATAEKLIERGWTLNENNTQQKTDSVYIPSDITNANPNFVVENAEIFWSTHNIEDVKDEVVFTLLGTVLSIGDPIDWNTGGPVSTITNRQQIIGFIPITISLDKVYKGNLKDDSFTFYVTSNKYDGKYHVSPDAANFETGEKVLVHLAHSDLGSFPDGHYYPKLAKFGKYQINENGIAFNVLHPNGISINSVIKESLP